MRLLIILLVLAALVYLLWQVGRAVGRAIRRRRQSRLPWEVLEESNGAAMQLYAVKPGQKKLLIGNVPFAAYDFDSSLYELRSEAQEKVIALNND